MFANHAIADGPPLHEDEDEYELKLAYAAVVHRNREAWVNAGFEIFHSPQDFGRALQCKSWIHDPIVNQELRRLDHEDKEPKKPNVEMDADIRAVRKAMMSIVNDVDAGTANRIKAGEVVLKSHDVGGFGRASTNNNIQNNITQNVMRVPMQVTEETRPQWEAAFKEQQLKLVADVRSSKAS